jgi:hypothetical protein
MGLLNDNLAAIIRHCDKSSDKLPRLSDGRWATSKESLDTNAGLSYARVISFKVLKLL